MIAERRRRDRREFLANAEREWVCGGPLFDAFKPYIGGNFDDDHQRLLQAELAARATRIAFEADRLAVWFAHRCNARHAVRVGMLADLRRWMADAGGPWLAPSHSTANVPTTGGTIPRLRRTEGR